MEMFYNKNNKAYGKIVFMVDCSKLIQFHGLHTKPIHCKNTITVLNMLNL